MKYIYTCIIILTAFVSMSHVYAGGAATGGSTFAQQVLQLAEEVPTNINSTITATQQTLETTKIVALDPIANGIISSVQDQAASDLLSWANGGFKGSPLIITNPERYIKDQGLARAKLSLGYLPSNSIYGDSIFNNLVDQYKDKGLKTKLEELSQSNIPSIVQNNICSDQALTDLALKDVRSGDGSYSQAALAARKNELYNYACTGNPKTDQGLAQRLSDLNAQNPSIGGWDSWLATTNGDNRKNKQALASQVVATEVEDVKGLTKEELYNGLNAISQRECLIYQKDIDGNATQTCEEWATLTPGDSVQDAISKAGTASFDRLANIMGSGALTSFLTTLAVSKISQGLNSAVTSAVKSSATGQSNTSSIITARAVYVQDLIGDPTRKTEFLRPILKQLTYYLTTLDSLEATDRSYLTDMNSYESKIAQGRSCYDSVVAANYVSGADSQVTSAYTFYADRQSRVNTVRNTVTPELKLITEARGFVNDTITKINASNSMQEISVIFNNYMMINENKNYPTTMEEGLRRGEYIRNQSDSSRDTSMTDYQNTCNQISTSGQQRSRGSGGGFN
jgi:hypothetical protein